MSTRSYYDPEGLDALTARPITTFDLIAERISSAAFKAAAIVNYFGSGHSVMDIDEQLRVLVNDAAKEYFAAADAYTDSTRLGLEVTGEAGDDHFDVKVSGLANNLLAPRVDISLRLV